MTAATPQDARRELEELERAYVYHPDDPRETVLAFVSRHRDELAEEFHESRASCNTESEIHFALLLFEEQRFGAQLYRSAHEVLWFGVKLQMAGPRRRGVETPWATRAERERLVNAMRSIDKQQPNERLEDYCNRILTRAGMRTGGPAVRSMPEVLMETPSADEDTLAEFEASDADVDWMEGE